MKTEQLLNEYRVEQDKLLLTYQQKLREQIILDRIKEMPIHSIIEDHIGRGEVIRHVVTFYKGDIKFEVKTFVHNLNKNGTISKREPQRYMYDMNIIKTK